MHSISGDQLTREMYQREVEGWEIFKRKDKKAYAAGYADDAVGFDLTGKLKDKTAAVNDIDAATVTDYEITDFQASSLAPDVALEHYLVRVAGEAAGKKFDLKMFVGAVFVRRDGRWLLRYFHNNAVDGPATLPQAPR